MRTILLTFISLLALSATACALFTHTERVPATLACDTVADMILVTAEDNGSADLGSCDLGLPGGETVHIELTREFDTDGTVAEWSGSIDPSTGLTCDDIDQIEGDCTLVAPGK